MLAWKRGIAILTASQVKVTPDPRVRLVNGYTLQIRDALPTDAGDYICQIATYEPKEIIHHVEILSKFIFSLLSKRFTFSLWKYLLNIILHLELCSHTNKQTNTINNIRFSKVGILDI